MKNEEVVLYTKLSPEECIKILRKNTDMSSFIELERSKIKFKGKIKGDKFELYEKSDAWVEGRALDGARQFHGRIIQEQNCTIIKGHFVMRPLAKTIALLLIVYAGVMSIINGIDYNLLFFSITFILGIVVISALFARRYEKILLDFLGGILQADGFLQYKINMQDGREVKSEPYKLDTGVGSYRGVKLDEILKQKKRFEAYLTKEDINRNVLEFADEGMKRFEKVSSANQIKKILKLDPATLTKTELLRNYADLLIWEYSFTGGEEEY